MLATTLFQSNMSKATVKHGSAEKKGTERNIVNENFRFLSSREGKSVAKRAESEQLRANLDFLPSVGETENERRFSRLSSVKLSRKKAASSKKFFVTAKREKEENM